MLQKLNSPKKIFSFFNTYKKYYTFINDNLSFLNKNYSDSYSNNNSNGYSNNYSNKNLFNKKEIFTILFLDSKFEFITMLHKMGNANKIIIDYQKILFYCLVILFHQRKNNQRSYKKEYNENNHNSKKNHQKIKVIFLHNHPSDVLMPSKKDICFTQKNQFFLKTIGIQLLDHLIYHKKDFFSFSKNKILF